MKRLRYSVIVLLVILGFFMNIERLDVGGYRNVIDLQSFIYVLAGVAVLVIIAIPIAWKVPSSLLYGVVVGVYLLCKLILSNDRPIIGGIYTYLTIAEVAMLGLLVLWSHRFSKNVRDVEETIANITMFDVSKRVKRLEDAQEEISSEILRSRRHQLALSVVLVKIDPDSIKSQLHQTAQDVLQAMMTRYVYTSLVRAIDQRLRRTDLILEVMNNDEIILLLPETTGQGSICLAERIQEIAAANVGINVACGIASFPNEALTFEELVKRAESYFVTKPEEAVVAPADADEMSVPRVERERISEKVKVA